MSVADEEITLKSVSTLVKSFINSRKPPVFLSDIVIDHLEVEGSPLPYRKFGFDKPETLLEATGEFILTRYGHDITVSIAKGSSKSGHIVKFVRSQKTSKSRHISTQVVGRKPMSYNKPHIRPFRKRNALPKSLGINAEDRNNNNNINNQKTHNTNDNNNTINNENVNNNNSSNNKKYETKTYINDTLEVADDCLKADSSVENKSSGNFRPTLQSQQKQRQQQQQQQQQKSDTNFKAKDNSLEKRTNDASNKNNYNKVTKSSGSLAPTTTSTKSSNLQDRLKSIAAKEYEIKNNTKQIVDMESSFSSSNNSFNGGFKQQMEKPKDVEQKKDQTKNTQGGLGFLAGKNGVGSGGGGGIAAFGKPKPTSSSSSIQDRLKLFKADEEKQEPTPGYPQKYAKSKSPPISLKKVNYSISEDLLVNKFSAAMNIDDPVEELRKLCRQLKYAEPQFKMLQCKFVKDLIGTVNVDGKIFSTYPNQYETKEEAEKAVALIALEKVDADMKMSMLPSCSYDSKEFLIQLYETLFKNSNGVFAKDIATKYEMIAQEKIHPNWWTLVQVSPDFRTEEVCENLIVYAVDPKKSEEEEEEQPANVTQSDFVFIPPVELPWSSDYWSLLITFCEKTTEVWACLQGIDYSDRYEELIQNIADHMTDDVSKWQRAPVITPKVLYLFYTNGMWHRVRVESIDKEKNEAFCFYIDFGDYGPIDVDNLYLCETHFLELPGQAIPFVLYGLEDFADHPKSQKILLENLLLKTVTAKVFTKEEDYFNLDSEAGGKIKIVLYENSPADDQTLNDLLIEQLIDCVKPPELKPNNINHVQVSHINDRGEVYVRIRNENLKYLENFMQKIGSMKNLEQHKVTLADFANSTKFLFYENSSNKNTKNWYRGNLNANFKITPSTTFVELFCVDIGHMCSVHISKIYRLESLSVAMATFPNQAIKVRLFNILELKPNMVGRLRALLPLNSEALVKVGKVKSLPLVTFYIRQNNGTLVNINDNLAIEQELEGWKDINCGTEGGNDEDNRSISSEGSAVVVRTREIVTGPMIAPSTDAWKDLPFIKKITKLPVFDSICLQVRVTLVASPWSFMIQPYERYKDLKELMTELQVYCNGHDELIPADMVQIGQAYATKHADGYYHRVKVSNILSNKHIQVTYIDLGDINTVRSDHLKFLPMRFRHLPEMAIHAKLVYLKPMEDNIWGQRECMRFRELTIGRAFISIITGRTALPDDGPRILMMDELIDVAESVDIHISDTLVQEKLAIKTTERLDFIK